MPDNRPITWFAHTEANWNMRTTSQGEKASWLLLLYAKIAGEKLTE
jgi:hypothetical protein